MSLRIHDFDFELPERLIAQHPAYPRDHAKLLVYDRATKRIQDRFFHELDSLLETDTTLVLNNSRVEKCRLLFEGGKIEVFVLDTLDPFHVQAMVRPGKKFKVGKRVSLTSDIYADVLAISEDGLRTLKLSHTLDESAIEPFKHTPLPPYIAQNEALSEEYQTIYAKDEGSKAAPTAGLHFSRELMKRLEIVGVDFAELTLHVGLGTFRAVEVEDLSKHKMDSEQVIITEKSVDIINRGIKNKRKICAVGTTSMRSIESSVTTQNLMTPFNGWTNKFIYPPYNFKIANCMITNLHTPKSTLMMMTCAFGGYELMMEAYNEAVKEKYRFFTYGDAMLIL